MRIHALGNSGFAVEKDESLLVMDCYNPKQHALLGDASLESYLAVTVLISHRHGDHYSRDIWSLKNASFVAGFDVPAPAGAAMLRPGERTALNGMQIRAYGSTDEGVSFHIEWAGRSLFHAGDLNDWHWRDDGNADYTRQAEAAFSRELATIKKSVPHIDIAFFPVDPRMGSDYYRGAILFAAAMRPKLFIPMHYGAAFAPPPPFYDEIAPYTTVRAIPTETAADIDETGFN